MDCNKTRKSSFLFNILDVIVIPTASGIDVYGIIKHSEICRKDVQGMEFNKLDKSVVKAWRMQRLFGILFLVLISVVASVILQNIDMAEQMEHGIYVAIVGLLCYKSIGCVVFPKIAYMQWGYRITEDRVEIRKGIFFIETTIVPVVRIQHITVSQGPIYRRLGLYKVEISLASGSFEIEGLTELASQSISQGLKDKLYARLESEDCQI